jgi:DNA-binding CsgD family transcriptional regulator
VVALERNVTRNLLIAATVLAGYGMRMEPRDDACERAPGVGVARALAGLTPREAEVLGLIECGEAPSSIAELLDVSPYTIRAQIRAIYRKLGVHNRAELREHRQQARDAVPADAPSSDGADVMRLDAMRRERRRPRPEWMRPPFSRSRTR